MSYRNVPKVGESYAVSESELHWYASSGRLMKQYEDGGFGEYVLAYNKSGSTISDGEVVKLDAANQSTSNGFLYVCTAGAAVAPAIVVGVAEGGAEDGEIFWVKISGVASVTADGGSVNIAKGDLLKTSTNGKVVKATANADAFAVSLSAITTNGAACNIALNI